MVLSEQLVAAVLGDLAELLVDVRNHARDVGRRDDRRLIQRILQILRVALDFIAVDGRLAVPVHADRGNPDHHDRQGAVENRDGPGVLIRPKHGLEDRHLRREAGEPQHRVGVAGPEPQQDDADVQQTHRRARREPEVEQEYRDDQQPARRVDVPAGEC